MLWIIGLLFFLFILRVPIAFALGISSMVGLYVSDISFVVIAQKIISGVDNFALIAVPLFILAGELMTQGGISKRLVHFAQTLFGHLTSGLAIVVVVASIFFSAVSGSAIATTAAIGGMMVPAMLSNGYDKRFTASLIPAAGTIGPIIPPSIIMILYGVMANVSIGDLFLAGFVPGLLMGAGLIAYAYVVGKKRGYKGRDKAAPIKEMLIGFKDAVLALIMPIIIIGGIVGGIFTPTESGVIAVVYALIIGMFVYKEITIKSLPKIFYKSAMTTATILFIIGSASLFTWLITINSIPEQLGGILSTFADNPILLLLVMNVILLIVGTFLDTISALIIFTPLFLPLALEIGVDPVHFGIILAVNLTIGMITPPMGVCLFVATSIAQIKMGQLTKDLVPMLIILIVVLMLITYIPSISLIIPRLFGT
jgi:C4-dicarboxylate transporter DctM subunit